MLSGGRERVYLLRTPRPVTRTALPLFGKCNILTVCTSGNFARRSIAKELNYLMIVFVILVIEVEVFEGKLAS
jgi:hypothetical protein